MKVYIVAYYDLKKGEKTISQEAYSTLEKAQAFINSRNMKLKKLNDFSYLDEETFCGYAINEVIVI